MDHPTPVGADIAPHAADLPAQDTGHTTDQTGTLHNRATDAPVDSDVPTTSPGARTGEQTGGGTENKKGATAKVNKPKDAPNDRSMVQKAEAKAAEKARRQTAKDAERARAKAEKEAARARVQAEKVAERQRIVAERKAEAERERAWRYSLLPTPQAAARLGIGVEIFRSYVEQASFAPDNTSVFRKWGRYLETRYYDPARLDAERPKIAAWQDARHQALAAKRQSQAEKRQTLVQKIKTEMDDLTTPETFGLGKAPFPRRVVFHCGPTNSGKTHNAFAALRAAASGVYAAPLRLLALEGWRALGGEDGRCRLVTGEEQRGDPRAPLLSCTIETLAYEQEVEIAVLDEIQMLSDPHRGWAWTQALLSLRAHTIVLAGSSVALPWIKAVLARTGETLEIVEHQRPVPLAIERDRCPSAEAGDAIVAFSRRRAFQIRNDLLAAGYTVSLIYGGLPPEVREHEAARFATGQAEVVVATDAIGMGLNLPIRRVLFDAFEKFDGIQQRALTPEEIRQIAGRAGRQGMHMQGHVGGYEDTPMPHDLANTLQPAAPSKGRPKPWWRPIEGLPERGWAAALHKRAKALDMPISPFKGAFDEGLMARAAVLSQAGFSLTQALPWLGAPVEPEQGGWLAFCSAVHHLRRVRETDERLATAAPLALTTVATTPEGQTPGQGKRRKKRKPPTTPWLTDPTWRPLEVPDPPAIHQTMSLYDMQDVDQWTQRMSVLRWIDTRWPNTFLDGAALARSWLVGTTMLGEFLFQGGMVVRPCNACGKALPNDHPYGICDGCHKQMYRSRRSSWYDDDDDDD